MAKDTWENIPYDKQPIYTAHSDGVSDDKHVILVDAAGDALNIDFSSVADGILVINDTSYYTKTKMDELLTALETRVKKYADDKDADVKSWVSSNFQHNA